MPVALEMPSFRDLVRRLRVPALVLAAVVAVALLSGGLGRTLVAAFERVLSADPAWAFAAAGFEILSFAGYIALTRHVTRLAWSDSYRTTLAGAAATRLLPTAGAGGAALTLWVLKRRGRDAAEKNALPEAGKHQADGRTQDQGRRNQRQPAQRVHGRSPQPAW